MQAIAEFALLVCSSALRRSRSTEPAKAATTNGSFLVSKRVQSRNHSNHAKRLGGRALLRRFCAYCLSQSAPDASGGALQDAAARFLALRLMRIPFRRLGLSLLLVAASWLSTFAAPENQTARTLRALFESEWDYTLEQSPMSASQLGDRRWNDQWDDVSLAAIERRHLHYRQVLE